MSTERSLLQKDDPWKYRLQTAMLLNILYHDGDNTAYVAAMFPTSYRAARRYAPTYRGGSTSVRGRIRSPHSCGGLA